VQVYMFNIYHFTMLRFNTPSTSYRYIKSLNALLKGFNDSPWMHAILDGNIIVLRV
jgi:hypothetical protein